MSRSATWTPRAAMAVFLTTTGLLWSQDALSVKLDPSGMVEIMRGKTPLATLDLNAHSAGWEYASQKNIKATVSELPGKAGKRFAGAFTIPKTEGAAIRFVESVRTFPEGIELAYDVTVEKTVRLNGLQVSVSLPVASYAGKEMVVSRLGGDPSLFGLPKEHQEGRSQVWTGEGSKIELAKGTDEAVTIALRAATDVLVQDLRQWQSPLFEVRFPAIMENGGCEVAAGSRFHLDITVTFAATIQVTGP